MIAAVLLDPFAEAVTEAMTELPTNPLVAMNVALEEPLATITDDGTDTETLLLVSATGMLLEVLADICTEQVETPPE